MPGKREINVTLKEKFSEAPETEVVISDKKKIFHAELKEVRYYLLEPLDKFVECHFGNTAVRVFKECLENPSSNENIYDFSK